MNFDVFYGIVLGTISTAFVYEMKLREIRRRLELFRKDLVAMGVLPARRK